MKRKVCKRCNEEKPLNEFRKIKFQNRYYDEIWEFCIENGSNILKYNNYLEHNDRYLKQCLYNLQEKADRGIITKEEWQKIEDKFGGVM